MLSGHAAAVEGPQDEQEQAIRQHRMGTLVVRARPGDRVKVTQLRHEFWFGTAVAYQMFRDSADPEEQRQYLDILKDNFNSAVNENALKWYATERKRGEISYEDVDRTLAWCSDNGMITRGHCVFWGVYLYVPRWQKELDEAELREVVERRAKETATRYLGRIGEYDVNNEMLDGSFYKDKLGEGIRAQMFRWVAEADPQATLYVNDYDMLSGERVAEYEAQIEALLAAGAPVGGIGCQGHFEGTVPLDQVKPALDRLARFGLPIKVTEFDIDTTDEEEKARLLGEFYRICFAHPAVEGILMWGFWEGAHWRPNAALWKQDFTPTPAAEVYRDLVFNRWWTQWEGEADEDGLCEVPAFYGRHQVEVDGEAREVDLPKALGTVEVDCRE